MNTPIYNLEVFDGPLDLLLSLIEKHKIDIYDIKISLLLDQYMDYINKCKDQNWNLTADFIEMTAKLIYIKSYALLPKQDADEDEDPKLQLELMLQEYAKYKQASGELRQSYIGSEIYFHESNLSEIPKTSGMKLYETEKLEQAYRKLLIKYSASTPKQTFFKKIIGTDYISVSSKITYLQQLFKKETTIYFNHIFDECKSKSDIIATFLALLEILRIGNLNMDETNNDIIFTYIKEQE